MCTVYTKYILCEKHILSEEVREASPPNVFVEHIKDGLHLQKMMHDKEAISKTHTSNTC